MPLYEYRCPSCVRVFEAYRRPSEETTRERCPVCGADSPRLGISLVSAAGTGPGSSSGGAACGGGSRRSPFS